MMCKCRQLPIYHIARIGNWNLKLATFADLDRRSLGERGWQHYPTPEPLRHPKITLSAKTALYRNLISTILGVPPLNSDFELVKHEKVDVCFNHAEQAETGRVKVWRRIG